MYSEEQVQCLLQRPAVAYVSSISAQLFDVCDSACFSSLYYPSVHDGYNEDVFRSGYWCYDVFKGCCIHNHFPPPSRPQSTSRMSRQGCHVKDVMNPTKHYFTEQPGFRRRAPIHSISTLSLPPAFLMSSSFIACSTSYHALLLKTRYYYRCSRHDRRLRKVMKSRPVWFNAVQLSHSSLRQRK